jgi:hypothetical protein
VAQESVAVDPQRNVHNWDLDANADGIDQWLVGVEHVICMSFKFMDTWDPKSPSCDCRIRSNWFLAWSTGK